MTARWNEVDDVIAALCADVETLAAQSLSPHDASREWQKVELRISRVWSALAGIAIDFRRQRLDALARRNSEIASELNDEHEAELRSRRAQVDTLRALVVSRAQVARARLEAQ